MSSSWLQSDFECVRERVVPVIPGHSFPSKSIFDSFDEDNRRKRSKTIKPLTWKQLYTQGTGKFQGVIARIESNILYVKDDELLGAVVLSKRGKARIGDVILVNVYEVRPIESAPKVDQMICSVPLVAWASTYTVVNLDCCQQLLTFPWEVNGVAYQTLDQAISGSNRLFLSVVKTFMLNDTIMQVFCQDQRQENAYLALSTEHYNVYNIRHGSIIAIAGCTVSISGNLYSITLGAQTIFEVVNFSLSDFFDDESSIRSIDNIASVLISMEKITEGLFEVTGRITSIGFGTNLAVISGTCPSCKKRCNMDTINFMCPSCHARITDMERWNLHFNCPISLSDESGTLKGIYLNDPIATDLFGFPPESYIRYSTKQMDNARSEWLFEVISLSINKQEGGTLRITEASANN